MGFDLGAFGRDVISVARMAGLGVASALVVLLLAIVLTNRGRMLVRLGWRGLAASTSHRRMLPDGLILATVGVCALTVNFSLEEEIRLGPNRMVEAMASSLEDQGEVYWVLQPGTRHFMNTSTLALPDVVAGLSRVQDLGGQGTPFLADLRDVDSADDSQTSLIIRVPGGEAPSPLLPEVVPGATCETLAGRCALRAGELVGDPDPRFPVGADVDVGGIPNSIVGHSASSRSLLNRLVFFGVFEAGELESVHGALILLPEATRQSDVESAFGSRADVLRNEDVLAANASFWTGNGTTLTLVLTVVTLGFAGAALYGHRRSHQEMSRRARGAARAAGLTSRGEGIVLLSRAILSGILAGITAWPAAIGIVFVANEAVPGFDASVAPQMAVSAVGVMLLAEFVAIAVLLRSSYHQPTVALIRE